MNIGLVLSGGGSRGVAEERMISTDELKCKDWFFCTKSLDKEKVFNEVLKK